MSALIESSEWLDGVSPVPWPLLMVFIWPFMMTALATWAWWMRGCAWPINCEYPDTVKKFPCRNKVTGEWFRCRLHNRKWTRKTDGHVVAHRLRRWENFKGKNVVEQFSVAGPGILRARASSSTLLYHRGFARPPGDVVGLLPALLREMRSRWSENRQLLELVNIRALRRRGEIQKNAEMARGLSERLDHVLPAMRMVLYVLALGLVLVIVGAFVESWRSALQYLSALAFLVVWAVTREGVWRAEPQWGKLAVRWTWATAWPALVFSIIGGALLSLND